MGAEPFTRQTSSDELANVLQELPQATLLAGGTDVGLWVTKQHRTLDEIVYTGNARELQEIEVTDTHLEIGAAVTLSQCFPEIEALYSTLNELFSRFASVPIRNSGTLGDNIANGSPIGDSMPVLISLDTTLLLRCGDVRREIDLEDFYLDYQITDLKPGEFLEKIRIPKPKEKQWVATYKVSKRFDQDISAACFAGCVIVEDKVITDIRLVYGGVAATIKRASLCETLLTGGILDELKLSTAYKILEQKFSPLDDMRASAKYRTHLCKSLLRRFLHDCSNELDQSVYRCGR